MQKERLERYLEIFKFSLEMLLAALTKKLGHSTSPLWEDI